MWEDQKMGLSLKALNGFRKDEVFPLRPGLTLGRAGDVQLKDAKVSSIHARVVPDPITGALSLSDNNSKNGLRIGSERVQNVPLKAGTRFFIADFEFAVIEDGATDAAARAGSTASGSEATEVMAPPEPAPASVPKPKPVAKQKYWYDVLSAMAEASVKHFQDDPKAVQLFEPALVLDFLRGIQATSRWTLGYGPRQIGSKSLDLPIWEPGAPGICFEVIPTDDGLLFKTEHASQVRLNGQEVDSQVLRVGDKIQIAETLIEVDFVE